MNIVENSDGSLDRASDAELKTIEVVRQIGQETLKNWARSQERKKAAQLRKVNPAAQQDKKKSPLA